MKVSYEWDAESVTVDEYEDVVDHNHGDLAYVLTVEPSEGCKKCVVLVRDTWDERRGIQHRHWAYVENGQLPQFFIDSDGREVAKVPKRFHEELRRGGL